ncbi:MAG: hypothetical protein AAB414_04040 [Patescibacteria group bacterium]
MAERTVTFADLRSLARQPRMGTFEAKCLGEGLDQPLITPLRQMADDIATWFNPAQGWKLVEVDFSFISPSRTSMALKAIEQLTAPKTEGRFKPLADLINKAKGAVRFLNSFGHHAKTVPSAPTGNKPEIDFLDLVFHFDAENPPLTPAGRKLNLTSIFSSDLTNVKREVRRKEGNVFVYPERVGSIYPLDTAQRELTSPYFLVAGRARVTSVVNRLWDFGSRHGEYDPKRSIAVLVFTEDLGDYLRAQEAQEGLVEQFNQMFPNTPLDQLVTLIKN